MWDILKPSDNKAMVSIYCNPNILSKRLRLQMRITGIDELPCD